MNTLPQVLIRGAGEMATGVAIRLHRSGFPVLMTELPQPLTVRRSVSFSEVVERGTFEVDGVEAHRVASSFEAVDAWKEEAVAVLLVPDGELPREHGAQVLVDAAMAKRNLGTTIEAAPLVIGLGPGFVAGVDVHYVIETERGPDLGRVLSRGAAHPRTGKPAVLGGVGEGRILRAPVEGRFRGEVEIGDRVEAGQRAGWVGKKPVRASCTGLVRGLIRDGLTVPKGWKVGDVDPRETPGSCFQVSDKAMAIAGGVLEAILRRLQGIDRLDSLPVGGPSLPARKTLMKPTR